MKRIYFYFLQIFASVFVLGGCGGEMPKRHMEDLGRGVVAVNNGDGTVFVSWRMLGTDAPDVGFNLYRISNGGEAVKLNGEPLRAGTNFTDRTADFSVDNSYYVATTSGKDRKVPSASYTLPANSTAGNYLSVPLRTPEGYHPNDGSTADLDGDGEYEIVVHMVGTGYDNAYSGVTTEPIFHAYKLDGSFLWEINLGKNIREGAHYTQFMVYDLDCDGKAEFVCKTADGTRDGKGRVLGDPAADWVEGPETLAVSRDRLGATRMPDGTMKTTVEGRILRGPEYLTVFSGETGEALSTVDYLPARGNVEDWGDAYGNRSERYLAGVACFDGQRPSVFMSRGYYGRAAISAWDFVDGELKLRWLIDSTDPDRELLRGQGNHNLSVADVDQDGRDEIVFGACVVDDDGSILNSTGLGHGNAMHVSDIDPQRPGLEVWQGHESRPVEYGVELHDARTGEIIWGRPTPAGGNRLMAADIDPRYPGMEVWTDQLYSSKGEVISRKQPSSVNFRIWWDGDLLAELFDVIHISKWNWTDSTTNRIFTAEGCLSNNGTKNTPVLIADILGDWREELILRSEDDRQLRIYTTTHPSDVRLYTPMHDPQYRLSIAWQNVAYNQPPHTGFFLGEGMQAPPVPAITTRKNPR